MTFVKKKNQLHHSLQIQAIYIVLKINKNIRLAAVFMIVPLEVSPFETMTKLPKSV